MSMYSRIDPYRLNTRKLHHEAVMYLLRLCANLKILHEAGQSFRADPSVLEEWAMHRNDLEACDEPVIRFSQHGHFREGEIPKHSELLLAANGLIAELKLRNIGRTITDITLVQVEALEGMAMRLDCRKQVVFY